jgi:cytochrome c oxidase subunit 4
MASTATEAEHRELSPAGNALIYLGLLILTASTYLLSRLHLGTWSLVIAMVIAIAKASLVVLFFMQLWYHRGSTRLALATAVLWLFLLVFFVVADVKTRFPLTNPTANPMLDLPASAPAGASMEPSGSERPQHQGP